jgi:prepilin-type processing-associated H-X9-DG protein
MAAARGVSGKAVASVVLGALVPVAWILTGLPAIYLGLTSLREINRSDGRLRGAKLAVAGMVLGALGTLAFIAGVLFVALATTHERSNRLVCSNNLMKIGQAVDLYHDRTGFYPPGAMPNADLPPERRLSWLVSLLPYPSLKYDAVFEKIDRKQAWDAEVNGVAVRTSIHSFYCLSNPIRAEPGAPALTHYVGLAGIGPDAATLEKDNPRAGFFGYDRKITRDDIQFGKPTQDDLEVGTGQTMMVTETAWHNGPWAAGGPPTLRGIDPATRPYLGPGRPFGGLHPNGLSILYVDGSVRFAPNTMNPDIFEVEATIHRDGE